MIRISKNTANNCIFTLAEKQTIASANFLCELVNMQSQEKHYCLLLNANELSTDTTRYNHFVITEGATPDPLLAEVELDYGDYQYNIYEQASATNINPALSGAIVETGICYVPGLTNTTTEYEIDRGGKIYER